MSRRATIKSEGNHRWGKSEVSIKIYGRDKICITEKLMPMLLQYKLQPHPNHGSQSRKGLFDRISAKETDDRQGKASFARFRHSDTRSAQFARASSSKHPL